ncbi:hypothetical protein HZC34_04120 [Candidatus Saganbacteria bacterium]|nr:hypothetical protein [Candidatus Saganbacteria bacterium]
MRTLIYVPIIHTSADLGSLSKNVSKMGIKELGEKVWEEHLITVDAFWRTIVDYFEGIEVKDMKIYQDGMVGEDDVGKLMVESGALAGSKNHELVLNLMNRGALLVKTEDYKLVKDERDKLLSITEDKSLIQKLIAFLKYKMVKDRLLKQRNEYIAGRIDKTLGPDERGVLFIGAYHNLKCRLPKDIRITEIKDADKIREYHQLLPFCNKKKKRFEELSKYLTSRVEV